MKKALCIGSFFIVASLATPAFAQQRSEQLVSVTPPQPGPEISSHSIAQVAAQVNDAPLSKKDLGRMSKEVTATSKEKRRWRKALNRRIKKRPKPTLNVYNQWTREMLAFDMGDFSAPAADKVNTFLRCHFTNSPSNMDPRLLPVLLQAAKHFKVNRVNIVSGFRDPKYNLSLRKKGHQVARNSEHTLGHAIDFRLPGVGTRQLQTWARKLKLGGVGFYRKSKFIHVDVGAVRYWNGS